MSIYDPTTTATSIMPPCNRQAHCVIISPIFFWQDQSFCFVFLFYNYFFFIIGTKSNSWVNKLHSYQTIISIVSTVSNWCVKDAIWSPLKPFKTDLLPTCTRCSWNTDALIKLVMCEGVFHSARCLGFSPSSSDGPLKHLDTYQLSSIWSWLFLWSASLFCLPDFTFTLLICCFLAPFFWVCYLRWRYSDFICHHLKLFISFWQICVLFFFFLNFLQRFFLILSLHCVIFSVPFMFIVSSLLLEIG